MYELIQAAGNSYYIQSPTKIGLVKTGANEVCIIDSGNDKSAGKKVLKQITEMGCELKCIFNTHSHADHIGGNKILQDRTGCKIFATPIERDFTEHTILESMYLYGANPVKDLRHKFMEAEPSSVDLLTEAVLPEGWEMIPLPGHSFDMMGFRSPDNVVYLADCLSSEYTMDKYQISFLVNVEAYLNTLKNVQEMEAALFIPAHAEATENIAPLAEKNIKKVYEIADRIETICREPSCFEEILKKLFDEFGLSMNFEQYVLVGSTVRSYLTWLKESGRLKVEFCENRLLWGANI